MEVEEQNFQCPYCWQMISFQLDLSVDKQRFIEDCEVCCRPIQMSYSCEAGELLEFNFERVQ